MAIGSTKTNNENPKCCSVVRFQGIPRAQAYAYGSVSHGAIAMSNVFLSASIIYLASDEAGCIDENDEVDDDCDERVYGFRPAVIVTNIAVIAGLVAAFVLPLFGAIIDYTSYRRLAGIILAISMFVIQAVQIGTVEATWFFMAILQAIIGALYEFHQAVMMSYLPDITRQDKVDESTMTHFCKYFYIIQFICQLLYLIAVVAISFGLDLDNVETGQAGQVICCAILSVTLFQTWKLFPETEPRHHLADGHKSLLAAGFRQNWKTCVRINQHSMALKWFFISVAVIEAGTSGILPISVTYQTRVLNFDSNEVGIAFVCALVGAVAGSSFGPMVTERTNPITSWKYNTLLNGAVTAVGLIFMTEDNAYLGYVFGFIWGFFLGWHFTTQQLLFSLCLPEGQEAELSGFFTYCTIILSWLPPLIFTIVVEAGASEAWGASTLVGFQALGFFCLMMMPSWQTVLEGAKKSLLLDVYDDNSVQKVHNAHSEEVETGPSSHPSEVADEPQQK